MASYAYTHDRPGETTQILVTATLIAKTDSEINAALGNQVPGTIIHTAGYGTMKQKGLDGTWTSLT